MIRFGGVWEVWIWRCIFHNGFGLETAIFEWKVCLWFVILDFLLLVWIEDCTWSSLVEFENFWSWWAILYNHFVTENGYFMHKIDSKCLYIFSRNTNECENFPMASSQRMTHFSYWTLFHILYTAFVENWILKSCIKWRVIELFDTWSLFWSYLLTGMSKRVVLGIVGNMT